MIIDQKKVYDLDQVYDYQSNIVFFWKAWPPCGVFDLFKIVFFLFWTEMIDEAEFLTGLGTGTPVKVTFL